ncbi:MAG: nucleotidyl transferase AbiEii/AbiGii toxin family protein [Thermoleophilaceae bacterium]
MASSAILAIDDDVDDHIRTFCATRPRLEPATVIRDIARIVCIANLVRNGTLDGEQMVLCGGMAMRCLDSPRISVFDGDTASHVPPDTRALAASICHDEDDMEIVAGPWRLGNQLVTFAPVAYDARFSQLAGAQDEFSLSVAHRGIERAAIWRTLNHRYPFPVLTENVLVPIMDPDEILAEKIVSWWLFGHAKHYNDTAFLAARLMGEGRDREPQLRRLIRALVAKKLDVNRAVSGNVARRVAALDATERRRRLADPDRHVDPRRDFDSLSYLHGTPPSRASVGGLVQRVVIPILFD